VTEGRLAILGRLRRTSGLRPCSTCGPLTADFMTLDREDFVRLTLATDGGDSARRAVLAPGQLTFELPAGPRTVQVLAVDAAGRTLTVRPVPR
jgi:hypothetical protein